MVILVTGANGQLGQAIKFISGNYPEINFVFCTSSELDITNKKNCDEVFHKYKPNYCINAAAYTAVDKAESEPEKAHLTNVIGAKNIAETCREQNTVLLHISTDFVFDGSQNKPYTELDIPNPTGVYGKTKWEGEKAIQEILNQYFIVRTSWVYSQFGANFMKTMLRLASERDTISVVNDQIGTPTNAIDLADVIIQICNKQSQRPKDQSLFGIYNFSNEGKCSWYDFAKKIFEINNNKINLIPISTTSYPTPAKRPAQSVLDKSKIKSVFCVIIGCWEDSLEKNYSNK
jgi:dTDP-4-dehydrorhamnose reductase